MRPPLKLPCSRAPRAALPCQALPNSISLPPEWRMRQDGGFSIKDITVTGYLGKKKPSVAGWGLEDTVFKTAHFVVDTRTSRESVCLLL